MNKRTFLKRLSVASGGLLLMPGLQHALANPQPAKDWRSRALRIHQQVLTLDSHCDTPLQLTREGFDLGKNNSARGGSLVDLPRMKAGGLDASFFAVFLGQGERTPEANKAVYERAMGIFDAVEQAVKHYPQLAEIALEPDDAYRLEKDGKRAIYLGIENGYPIGKDLNKVAEFYARGTRYITLCHSSNNDICDSSTDEKGPEHNGISSFGKQVVAEMNRLGIMVDVSHVSDKAFYDAATLSQAPVIASHSSARAICDHPRNMDDDMLRRLADTGGVIQLCILSDYIKTPAPNPEKEAAMKAFREKYPEWSKLTEEQKKAARKEWYAMHERFAGDRATVADAVDHIDHIVKVAGIDHVGIGTDFDGGGGLADCRDASELPNISKELVKRGYSKSELEKIWGGNFMRVFRQNRALNQG